MSDARYPPPRRKWGQHFLSHPNTGARIVAALGLRAGEVVLEIGPGRGALTALLAETTAVVAVEINPLLAADLRRRFSGQSVLVLERDILSLSLDEILAAAEAPRGSRLVVVGNLPYNISKPLASRLIRERRHVARAVLMFQREVAQRMLAKPSTRAYAPLAVLASEAYRIEKLFDVAPSAFRPAPSVTSTVMRWIARPDEDLTDDVEVALRACLSACFAMRRRTLLNNLRHAFPERGRAEALLQAAEIDGGARAEALTPDAYRRLARLWPTGERNSRSVQNDLI